MKHSQLQFVLSVDSSGCEDSRSQSESWTEKSPRRTACGQISTGKQLKSNIRGSNTDPQSAETGINFISHWNCPLYVRLHPFRPVIKTEPTVFTCRLSQLRNCRFSRKSFFKKRNLHDASTEFNTGELWTWTLNFELFSTLSRVLLTCRLAAHSTADKMTESCVSADCVCGKCFEASLPHVTDRKLHSLTTVLNYTDHSLSF